MPATRRQAGTQPGLLPQDYIDKDPDSLEKDFIDQNIGYGLVTNKFIAAGDFIINYRGKRQGKDFRAGTYVFHFGNHSIDATKEDSGLARYINDRDFKTPPNCVPKPTKISQQQTIISLFAISDIQIGELNSYLHSREIEENLSYRISFKNVFCTSRPTKLPC